jgi:hypothetical protein
MESRLAERMVHVTDMASNNHTNTFNDLSVRVTYLVRKTANQFLRKQQSTPILLHVI